MAAVVNILVGVALQLKHIVETNLRNKSKLTLCKP